MKKRLFGIVSVFLVIAVIMTGCGSVKEAPKAAAGSSLSKDMTETSVSPEKTMKNETEASPEKTVKSETVTGPEKTVENETAEISRTSEYPDTAAELEMTEPAIGTMGIAKESYSVIQSNSLSMAADGYYDEIMEDDYYEPVEYNTEEYKAQEENRFRSVKDSPLSTFGADVDTASYANLRRLLQWGNTIEEIPSGAVRAEEMINYFTYNYAGPEEGEPFGINAVIADCPWNPEHKLLLLGLQTEEVDFSETPDTNLVFLIDVSGSMDEENKLPLLKESFSMLAEQLGEKDRVSIVTYASSNDIVLEGAHGDETEKIVRAINSLEAGGSTNGGQGIISAYDLAEQYFIEGGNNRVIIASDGDFNVGITSESALYELISKEKEKGIFLSVLGFGTGNYSDARMETLADKGNGNYSYIDSVREAKKVLVDELSASLLTVAKDVKFQIEFNPVFVSEYRQIGYENRAMAAEDFADDKKDGGEIGAGHSMTVLYELVPADAENTDAGSLKYQDQTISDDALETGEWLTVSVRYKEPDEDVSKLLEYPITKEALIEAPSDDFRFAAAVAEFAMVLNESEYIADGGLRHVKDVLDELDLSDEYRNEFADLVYMVR